MPTEPEREYLTLHETASIRRCSPARIVAMVETGALTAHAIGPRAIGFDKAEVLALARP